MIRIEDLDSKNTSHEENEKCDRSSKDVPLEKMSRLQVTSFIKQLEENNYVGCPYKDCSFIALSIIEIGEHILECADSENAEYPNLCKYCLHSMKSPEILTNHVIFSHPEVVDDSATLIVEDETVKKAKLENPRIFSFLKFFMRVSLQEKGFLTCFTPTCHYVSSLIPVMENHFINCSPTIADKLKFQCDECGGETFTQSELSEHIEECHPLPKGSDCPIASNFDARVFWELSLKEIGASKCITDNCFYVSSQISQLEEHYKYCRVPREENYDVCPDCHGWFESLKDLESHKAAFHCSHELSNKMNALVSLRVTREFLTLTEAFTAKFLTSSINADETNEIQSSSKRKQRRGNQQPPTSLTNNNKGVNYIGKPNQTKKRKKRRRKVVSNPSAPTKNIKKQKKIKIDEKPPAHTAPEEIKQAPKHFDEVDIISCLVNRKESCLEQLGKIIKLESKNKDPINIQIAVGDQSWDIEAPSIDKANEVINRKMPSFSMKNIVTESLENSLSLLKLSFRTTKIECNLSKHYFPPKPLDFALGLYYPSRYDPSQSSGSTFVNKSNVSKNSKSLTRGKGSGIPYLNDKTELSSIKQKDKKKKLPQHMTQRTASYSNVYSISSNKDSNNRVIPKTYRPLHKTSANEQKTSVINDEIAASSEVEKSLKNISPTVSNSQKCSLLQQQSILDAIKKFGVDPSKISEVRVRKPNHMQVFNLKGTPPQAIANGPSDTFEQLNTPSLNQNELNTNPSDGTVLSSSIWDDDTRLENDEQSTTVTDNEAITKLFRTYSRVKPYCEHPLKCSEYSAVQVAKPTKIECDTASEDFVNLPTDNVSPTLFAEPDSLVGPEEENYLNDTSEVPYEVIWESDFAMKGGFYNSSYPWEKRDKNSSLGNNGVTVLAKNPYRSSKLRAKTTCENCRKDKPLNGSTDLLSDVRWCDCISKNQEPDFGKQLSDDKCDKVRELTDYLTEVRSTNFVNEPMVYVVDKIIIDSKEGKNGISNETESEKTSNKKLSANESKKTQSRKKNKNSKKQVESSEVNVPLPIKSDSIEIEPKRVLKTDKRKRKGEALPDDALKHEVKKKRSSKKSLNQEEPCSPEFPVKSKQNVVDPELNNILPNENDTISTPGCSSMRSSQHVETPVATQQNSDSSVPENRVALKTGKNTANATNGRKPSLKSRRSKGSPRKLELPLEESKTSDAQIKAEPNEESTNHRPPSKKKKSRKSQPSAADDEENDSRFLYLDNDQQLGKTNSERANERITFNTKIMDPHRLVVCAICGDNMSVLIYKNTHMVKHNYLCWLVGETPMNLEDDASLERLLYKIYTQARTPFICENCGAAKKSPQGFLSHRKLCGKSVKERSEILVSCKLCSRMLLPVSLPHHMARNHAEKKNPDEEVIIPLASRSSETPAKMAAAINAINDNTDYIDESEEFRAATEEKWIKFAYGYSKRRLSKNIKNILKETATKNEYINCIIDGCTFNNQNINVVFDHYKLCDKSPLDMKCKECHYYASDEARIINHVRMTHSDKAHVYASKTADLGAIADTSEIGGTFIPYVKSAELNSRSFLYLQPALCWTHNLHRNFMAADNVFPYWNVDCTAQFKSLDQFSKHIDLKEVSMRVAFNEKKLDWCNLKKLTSHCCPDGSVVFYTGGAVRTLDWFPSPNEQYMAICIGSPDYEATIKSVHSGPGHIQIWSAGSLDNFSEQYSANLKFELAVCHDFGEIWDLQCCPAVCIDYKRLGAVAIATSSGKVAIYTIPLMDSAAEHRAFMPEPTLVMELGTSESHQVTKVSWSKVKPHRLLAAGYSNGLVAVWDLTSDSSLLKLQNGLLPFKIFSAHLSIITALSFSPVNEYYLVSACAEKSSKQWDLRDTSRPQSDTNKGLVTDAAWMCHWMSTVTALDDNYTTGSTTLCLNTLRNFVFQSQSLVTFAESTPLSVSVNDWINSIVCGYDNGQVLVHFGRKQIANPQDDRKKIVNCLVSPEWHDFDPKAQYTGDSKSYSETSKRFGIIFKRDYEVLCHPKFKSNPYRDMENCPSLPAKKVIWNPNRNSFLTLAAGFQSGFVIINRIKFPGNESKEMSLIMSQLNEERNT